MNSYLYILVLTIVAGCTGGPPSSKVLLISADHFCGSAGVKDLGFKHPAPRAIFAMCHDGRQTMLYTEEELPK
jgi:hypothetical protein